MKYILTILLVFSMFHSFAQIPGLNCEIGLNNHFRQRSLGLEIVGDYAYLLHNESISQSYFTYCYIKKIDTLGNIVWSGQIMPSFHEYTDMKEIISSGNNEVYVLGWGTEICDVAGNSDYFIIKYDESGTAIWTKTWIDQSWFSFNLKGLKVTDSGNLLVSYTDDEVNPNETKIYAINPLGSLVDSLIVPKPLLDGVDSLIGYERIGFKQDSLFGFDNAGNTSSYKTFTSNIQSIEVLNDTLYVLTSDSIFLLDPSFQILNGANVSGYFNYSKLKISSVRVEFTSNSGSTIALHSLNHGLQVLNTETIMLQVNPDDAFNYGNKHISVAINHDLSAYEAIRFIDYSRESSQNEIVNTTDIGIIDLLATQTEITYFETPGVYTIKIWADALIKNYGNNQLDNCKINHVISQWGICNPSVYTEHFSSLNLQANDSMWVSLGLVHLETNYFGTDTIGRTICAYTSHPNYVSDLNVSNDDYCEYFILGFIGIKELEPNERKLVSIVDTMGRSTEDKPNQLLIYIYSDGTTEKVFRVE